MDLFSTSRSSSNFIQYKNNDGSLDYSADWDTFSFENELNTRENILKEDLKAYNHLLDETSPDSSADIGKLLINEMKDKVGLVDKLLETHKDYYFKYNSLLEESKKIKDNMAKLTAKNDSLQKTINNLEEEETTSRKDYKQLKLALQKASEMYTTYFNINISTKTLSDTTYEASLYFNEKDDSIPIKFTTDRIERKIIDFQPNGALLQKEEDIRKKYGNLKNISGLFCALHDIVSKN
ncbi:protein MLP2-like [Anoplophora glabripennis]|uniref:protein MLP2-like n=1 Tax=Anoplophora glabripennis TaxID=217634 RepID=UPI0008751460|nr:protein MLP2-like [Anoplophora glabripennis]